MTALHSFAGVRPWLDQLAQEAEEADAAARREEVVAAARVIVDNPQRHTDDVLLEACVALRTFGDGLDYLRAGQLMDAIRERQRVARHAKARRITVKPAPPPQSAGPRMVKTALIVICAALALWVCMEIGAGIARAAVEISALADAAQEVAKW